MLNDPVADQFIVILILGVAVIIFIEGMWRRFK